MKISLENALKAANDFLADEFAKNQPESLADAWSNVGLHIAAEYKLATQGSKALKLMDDGSGYIDLDVLSDLIKKYAANLPDKSFNTFMGEIKIKSETPAQLMEFMKKYGEN